MLSNLKTQVRASAVRAVYALPAARHARARREKSREVRRILVIRPDHLGDMLFATPALDLLREYFPEAHITGAVGPWGAGMWSNNPNLDALIKIPFPGIATRRTGGPLGSYRLIGRVARLLAREEYDLGIVLRFDHWWGAALLWAAGIPARWGYDTPGTRGWLTHTAPYVRGRHEVEQNLRLIEALIKARASAPFSTLHIDRNTGTPPLTPPLPEPLGGGTAGTWLNAPRRVAIHPGTGAANKLWTISGWAYVADQLASQGWVVALTGSTAEGELCEAVALAAECKPLNLAGQTATLGQLAWLFERASMVLGVDSGPLHIAAALHTPSLHLYGPSDEKIWGPWGDPEKHRAFRAPGTHPTMRLEVESKALEGGPEMRAITRGMVMEQVKMLETFVREAQ